MSTKHIYNSPEGLVLKSLQGAVSLNPSLRLHQASKSIYTSPLSSQTKVSVISGGGAGHEPAHAMYTGYGMLAASVSGEIFASPSAKQILSTIRFAAYGGDDSGIPYTTSATHHVPRKDVLIIINNYTGDRLNFGLAIEKARAEGIRIDSVVVADDVSLLHSANASLVGPRGLAGNILVCKVLGALAERGSSLENLKWVGDIVVMYLASIGVGLEHCHIPGSSFNPIGDTECEVGLGLHNEPGVQRMKLVDPAKLVEELVGKILRSRGVVDGGRDSFIQEGDTTVLFVNNLGGMSQLEMGATLSDVLRRLALSDIHPSRIYSSSFMTSLNAPGFSISLLNVSAIHHSMLNEPRSSVSILHHPVDVLQLLDDPTEAHSWAGVGVGFNGRRIWESPGQRDVHGHEARRARDKLDVELSKLVSGKDEVSDPRTTEMKTETEKEARENYWSQADISPHQVTEGIENACKAILREESVLTEYDTIVGDGDCGMTFSRGAKAILSAIENRLIVVDKLYPDDLIQQIGDMLEDNMGGTVGALSAIFFTAWSSAIKRMIHPRPRPVSPSTGPLNVDSTFGYMSGKTRTIQSQFMDTLADALVSLSHHTSAKPGDRTLMDALYPFCARDATEAAADPPGDTNTIVSNANLGPDLFTSACLRAREGASSTRGMKPRLGRAVYVKHTDLGKEEEEELPPDPGAWGVAVLVDGFWEGFCGRGSS